MQHSRILSNKISFYSIENNILSTGTWIEILNGAFYAVQSSAGGDTGGWDRSPQTEMGQPVSNHCVL